MPWCEGCSKFWQHDNMGEGGTCPTCGTVITKPARRVPWHFKLMLVALVIYLIYRVYWLALWLPKHV